MREAVDQLGRSVSPALLRATAATLQRLGPKQFNLTAVAEAAGVSRGTVHNALGNRDAAIKTALDYVASVFIEMMAGEVRRHATLADQAAAAAVLICSHRQRSGAIAPGGLSESVLLLLLRNSGDDLMKRSIELWKPLVRAAQERGEVRAGVEPAGAAEWIVRMLLSFELLPPMRVNLDNPRAVRRFVSEYIVAGLVDNPTTSPR
ncbi:TetR/AcrR family transcriptional regulator [Nocardia sp. NPDC051570]|uniref:TetR/AcrR family transcriptional regulator n=1 Tax=Nocardia sp. NPDC051570 TaxID=3364324 RepID=UPI0037B09EC1